MYFPYLRGKQFELLALREFANQNANNNTIIPIIEPVKDTFNSLRTAIEVMFKQGLRFALVLNPNDGDFKKSLKTYNILQEIPCLLEEENKNKWIPAFLYNDEQRIITTVNDNSLTNIMIIFKNSIDSSKESIFTFLGDPEVQYIVNGDANNRSVVRKLSHLRDKSIIRLDNCFNEQPRNVDYIEIDEEPFSEEHLYYESDGYAGFSDYTTLPKDFIDGGMLPYAIAIHLTYKREEGEVYIKHFVSDTNFDQSNVQKKFFEAASKVKTFFENRDRTAAIDDLIKLVDDNKYPGLGVIKKLSIRSHIELINSLLN